MSKIKLNAAKCKKCKMLMASQFDHDLVACPCGNFVDGGKAYLRRGGNPDELEELSVIEEELENG